MTNGKYDVSDNAASATDQIVLDGLCGVSKRRKQEPTSREAFEAFAIERKVDISLDDDGMYSDLLAHKLWLTW